MGRVLATGLQRPSSSHVRSTIGRPHSSATFPIDVGDRTLGSLGDLVADIRDHGLDHVLRPGEQVLIERYHHWLESTDDRDILDVGAALAPQPKTHRQHFVDTLRDAAPDWVSRHGRDLLARLGLP